MHLLVALFFFGEKCLATDRSYIISVYLAFFFRQFLVPARLLSNEHSELSNKSRTAQYVLKRRSHQTFRCLWWLQKVNVTIS